MLSGLFQRGLRDWEPTPLAPADLPALVLCKAAEDAIAEVGCQGIVEAVRTHPAGTADVLGKPRLVFGPRAMPDGEEKVRRQVTAGGIELPAPRPYARA